jgi:hypothetical protein
MDGGFGEAALMGALVGGGASLLTGKNPLTGALLGGVTGGAMSGISGALAGTTDTVVKDQIINNAIENAGVNSGVIDQGILNAGLNPGAAFTSAGIASPGASSALTSGLTSGAGAASASELANAGLTGLGGMQNVGLTQGANAAVQEAVREQAAKSLIDQGVIADTNFLPVRNLANSATSYGGNQVINAAPVAAQSAASKGVLGGIKDWYATAPWYEKAGAGIAGSVALNKLFEPPELLDPNIGKTKIDHPLASLSPDFQPLVVTPPTPYYTARYAEGGIAAMAGGGDPVNFMGDDMYPQSQIPQRSFYATPSQMPTSAQQAMASYEPNTNPLTGEVVAHMAEGGIANLGGYSDGGRLLRGPGDGMSDDIPASIGAKQPARLADGEFVVPADVVSHLGNGSTDAGAKQLYAMMDKVRHARTGNKKQGKQIKPEKYIPA